MRRYLKNSLDSFESTLKLQKAFQKEILTVVFGVLKPVKSKLSDEFNIKSNHNCQVSSYVCTFNYLCDISKGLICKLR